MVKEQNKNNIHWSPHVFETNVSSTSSCTIPMLILKQAKENGFDCVKYKVHNADQVYGSQFSKIIY